MPLAARYRPPNAGLWQGRFDGCNSFRMHEIIQAFDMNGHMPQSLNKGPVFGLLGFASDEGIKRNQGNIGAFHGPLEIRKALVSLPSPTNEAVIYDCGDILCEDENLEEAQASLGNATEQLLNAGIIPILLGGGHEIAWGSYQGIAKKYSSKKIAIFNFDAHFDLRDPIEINKSTSGSSFSQIIKHARENKIALHYNCLGVQRSGNTDLLFQKAKEYNTNFICADELHLCGVEMALELIDEQLNHVEIAYVSICLDVFAAPFAPGVSAPQVLGLFPWHVIPLLQRLTSSGKVVVIDIAELSPPRDSNNITAQLAAQLLFHALTKFKVGNHK